LPLPDDRIRCLRGAFTPAECAALVCVAERAGFCPAPLTTSTGFVMNTDVRNNTRVMLDDAPRAEALWCRLAPSVPERLGRFRAVGLNERLRFYRYGPGEFFAWHRDGAFWRSNGERSLITLMVYLNEGFEGGSTDFDLPEHEGPVRVVPETGM